MIKNLKFILSAAFLFVTTGLFFEKAKTSEPRSKKNVTIRENENKVTIFYDKNRPTNRRGGATSTAFAASKQKNGFFSKKNK